MLGARSGDEGTDGLQPPKRKPPPLRNWEASDEKELADAGSCLNPEGV